MEEVPVQAIDSTTTREDLKEAPAVNPRNYVFCKAFSLAELDHYHVTILLIIEEDHVPVFVFVSEGILAENCNSSVIWFHVFNLVHCFLLMVHVNYSYLVLRRDSKGTLEYYQRCSHVRDPFEYFKDFLL